MENKANRWMTSLVLLSMFGVIAVAGSRATRAQGTQNVLVTNTSSQQVPVLPAARPAPGGAYIVSVANAPNVKVVSSPTTPVSIKEVNNVDTASQVFVGAGSIPASVGFESAFPSISASGPWILDGIDLWDSSTNPGEAIDLVEVMVNHGGQTVADLGYPLQAPIHGSYTMVSVNPRIAVPAGSQVSLTVLRFGGSTGLCNFTYNLMYHTIQSP